MVGFFYSWYNIINKTLEPMTVETLHKIVCLTIDYVQPFLFYGFALWALIMARIIYTIQKDRNHGRHQ